MSGDTHLRTIEVRNTQSAPRQRGVARRAALPAVGLAAALLLGACTISIAQEARGRGIPTPRAPAVIGGASPTIPASPTATAVPAPPPTAPPAPTIPIVPTLPPAPAPAQPPIVVEGGVIVPPAPDLPPPPPPPWPHEPPPHPRPPPGDCGRRVIHVVRAHETLYSIAVHHRTTAAEIMRINRIRDPRSVAVGRRLVLVECGGGTHSTHGARRYVVRAGDNLFRIGLRFGVSVAALRTANGLHSNDIRVGQVLVIP